MSVNAPGVAIGAACAQCTSTSAGSSRSTPDAADGRVSSGVAPWSVACGASASCSCSGWPLPEGSAITWTALPRQVPGPVPSSAASASIFAAACRSGSDSPAACTALHTVAVAAAAPETGSASMARDSSR
jgi:hypothetical protein